MINNMEQIFGINSMNISRVKLKKRLKYIVVLFLWIFSIFLFVGCNSVTELDSSSVGFTEFEFIHYSSGSTSEIYKAVILFEQSVSTFTAYQVAFVSCTCRDVLANYYSICYVELLNTRPTAEEAAIRAISFGNNMGLWGDSNPNYYIPEYTQEYMDEHFVQRLVRATKGEFDAWEGYGTQLDCIDVDAVSGASVSTGNITSMLKSLFQYHTDKYYGE